MNRTWFVKVWFRDNKLYAWLKEVPGVSWDRAAKCSIVPVEVLPLLQEKAAAMKVKMRYETILVPGDNSGEDSASADDAVGVG